MISATLLRSFNRKYYEFYVKPPLVLYRHKGNQYRQRHFYFMHFQKIIQATCFDPSSFPLGLLSSGKFENVQLHSTCLITEIPVLFTLTCYCTCCFSFQPQSTAVKSVTLFIIFIQSFAFQFLFTLNLL
jgi:hypothetical protein